MSEFSELVKRVDKVRSYVRDFYIYGFKSREDFSQKSGRTYDNERRRMESWFYGYIKADYTGKRKSVAITIDTSRVSINLLYNVWRAKSFTDNDIMLHFYLLDLLQDQEPRSVGEITDEIQANYGQLFDPQTVRKKLVEYAELGLVIAIREAKQVLYACAPSPEEEIPEELQALMDAVCFYQGATPFGFIGSTILDNQQVNNRLFSLKHDYLVHTLEDEILLELLEAIREHRQVTIENQSTRSGSRTRAVGVPMKILVSTQTGRRYVCLRLEDNKRFNNYRLDCILKVVPGQIRGDFDRYESGFLRHAPLCWGVSFGQSRQPEILRLTLSIDEKNETYILQRLDREGRGGSVTREAENRFVYEGHFYDVNEMLPWVKTFTGRILRLDCSNAYVTQKFYRDMQRMTKMYEDEDETTPKPNGGEA